MPANTLIFIYGTLRREGRAHRLMLEADFQCLATTSGRIVHVDQYPGLILDSENSVIGELYIANDKLVRELDQYEGCFESPPLYIRQEITVIDENGKTHQAQTYVFQRLEPHHKKIQSGDWIKWVNQ